MSKIYINDLPGVGRQQSLHSEGTHLLAQPLPTLHYILYTVKQYYKIANNQFNYTKLTKN